MPPLADPNPPAPVLADVPVPDLLAALRDHSHVDGVWIFGSAARGELRPDSDLDLALRFASDGARAAWLADPLPLWGALCIAARRPVHLVDVETAPLPLRMQIGRHGVALLDRAPDRTRTWLERTLVQWCDFEPAWRHAIARRG